MHVRQGVPRRSRVLAVTAADDRYTITGPNACAVGTCTLCGFTTATGYATHAHAAIHAHLATNHPARDVIATGDGLRLIAVCPAGHDYWVAGHLHTEYVYDTWWDLHRHHEKQGRHHA